MRQAMLVAAVVTAFPWIPIQAQRVPLARGDRARVASADSAARGLWFVGNVLDATRIGVLLAPAGSPPDSVPIPFGEHTRLQVSRHSGSTLILGGGAGLVLGVGAGLLLPASTFGASWNDPGHVGEVIAGALVGTGVGLLAGVILRPARWEEVQLSQGMIAVAPLNHAPTHTGSFLRVERWDQFDPTEADFAAFFYAHRDSLAPIEGAWERADIERGSGQVERVAIVRDRRYEGYEYVAARLPERGARGLSSDDGVIQFVLTKDRGHGVFEVRVTGAGSWEGRLQAALEGGESLHVRQPNGSYVVWIKLAQREL